jgi:RNA polymerase sigma-70 factor (ECF subfamily)
MIYHLSFNYLKDNDLAEDITQQVFLKLWEIREQMVIYNDLGNYLYTMAKNNILQTIRQKNLEVLQAYEMELLVYGGQEEQIDKNIDALYSSIEKLPDKKKSVCLMKLKEKASNEEISIRLGISIQTVKNHYNQSLKFLRNDLEGKILIFILTLLFKHL